MGRALKSWETSNFSLPALRQRMWKKEDVEESAAPPREVVSLGKCQVSVKARRGKEHYVKWHRSSRRQSERGGRKAVGG